MVEEGPYIEFRCEPYVAVSYVKSCVLAGLLLVAALCVLVILIRRFCK